MKKNWESGPAYCSVTPYEVVVGSNPGGSGHTDNAAACSHKDFMEGCLHDTIRDTLGIEVLREVIDAVRASGQDLQSVDVRDKDVEYLEAWKEIPEDISLAALAKNPDDEGMNHYGTEADSGTTIVSSNGTTLKLPFGKYEGKMLQSNGTAIDIPERGGPVLEHNGYFYIADLNLSVYDSNGKTTFSTKSLEKTMDFGNGVRIYGVTRCGNKILARYRFFPGGLSTFIQLFGERGLLEIDPKNGIISRCKEEV